MATDNETYTYVTDPETKSRYVDIEEGLKIYEEIITREGSDFKGLSWHRSEFASTGKAVEKLGEDAVLNIVNDRLAQLQYIRATGAVKGKLGEDKTKWAAQIGELYATDKCIFTIDDALNFKPGEREQTPKQLAKLFSAAFANSTKLMREGKPEEARKEMELAMSLMQKMATLADAKMDQLEAAAAVAS